MEVKLNGRHLEKFLQKLLIILSGRGDTMLSKSIFVFMLLLFVELSAQPMYYEYNGSEMLPSSLGKVAWKKYTINIGKIPNVVLPTDITEQRANMALDQAIFARHFIGNDYNFHIAIDITAPTTSPVYPFLIGNRKLLK